jgi:hypothetical protein
MNFVQNIGPGVRYDQSYGGTTETFIDNLPAPIFFRSLMMRSSVDGQDSLVGIMLGSRYHCIETTYLVCRDYPGNQELMPSNDNYTASCGLMVYALGGQTMFQLSPEYQNSRENAGMELNMFLCFIMVKDQKGILQCFIHSCIYYRTFSEQTITYDMQNDTVSWPREVVKGVMDF